MKKFLITALLLLAGLGKQAEAANLYASNLGSGQALIGGTTAMSSGTVRFGVFPAGFDFAANASNFSALDTAFTEVASYSGNLSANSVQGFFQMALTYSTAATYEGTSYDATPGSTANTSTTDIAGEKVYIWILNNTTASAATEQAIYAGDATWVDADAAVQDTIVSPDSGTPGLVAHLGGIAQGSDLGAGASANVTGGATDAITELVAVRTPSTPTVIVGTRVTFSYTAQGTQPFTQQWFRVGNPNPLGSGTTFVIPSAQLTNDGDYYVRVSNAAGAVTSANVNLDVISAIPVIEDEPDAVAANVGGTVQLSVVAKGQEPLTYKWMKGTTAVPGGNKATLDLYGLALTDGGLYHCEVSNKVNGVIKKDISAKALVTVVQDNTPAARRVVLATSTLPVTLEAFLNEAGAPTTGKATYQWYKDGEAIENAFGKKLTIPVGPVAATAPRYHCEVTPAGLTPLIAATTEVFVVNQAPAIVNPTALNMPDGIVGGLYTFTVPVLSTNAASAAKTFSASGLPDGLSIHPSTGEIKGRPTKAVTDRLVTITVSNGVTPNAVATDTITIAPLPTGLAGSYTALVSRGDLSLGLGGRLDLTVTTTGGVSGTLYLGTQSAKFAGGIEPNALDNSATATFTFKRLITQRPVELTFTLANNLISQGSVDDGVLEPITFQGWKRVWKSLPVASQATAYVGRYHAGLDLADEADFGAVAVPQGIGYASFTVGKDGAVLLSGKTSDGQSVTGSTFLGPNGEVLIFKTLYLTVTKGSLLGSLMIDDLDTPTPNDNKLGGDADWNRPASTSTTYGAGFEPISLSIFGGIYRAPVRPRLILNLLTGTNNATVAIIGGGVEEFGNAEDDVVENASVKTGNFVTVGNAKGLSIKFNTLLTQRTASAAKGTMVGSFKKSGITVPLSGLIIPTENGLKAMGYFTNKLPTSTAKVSGAFVMQPQTLQ